MNVTIFVQKHFFGASLSSRRLTLHFYRAACNADAV